MDLEQSNIISTSKPSAPSPARRASRTGSLVVLVSIFLALAFFLYNFQFVIVEGESMRPTLVPNERILICKALWALGGPKHGDIVVLDTDNGFIVKRVAYVAGEVVPPGERPFDWPISPDYVVPPGSVYVLGDNLPASEDSRTFGPVRVDHILGKAMGF